MADFSPDDLSREIDRLWARVGSASAEPSSPSHIATTSPAGATIGAEAAWETVALLKRQQRQREHSWQQTMEARDEALRALRARLETAETELGRLRLRSEGEDERTLVGTLDAQQRIETASKALALAEARHAEERQALAEAMQSLRERIAAETARAKTAEQRWQAREQQYLLDVKELQGLVARRDQDAGASDKEIRSRDASLAEAKNALQKTLAELLLERKERERAHVEREAALKKVDELRAHVDELSRIWEEERAQWRELWDRERSTWETQRGELAHWEESLRREREAWHAELQVKEKTHLELTEDLSGKIRETSLTAEKMSELISDFDRKSSDDSARAAEGTILRAAQDRIRAERRTRWVFAAALLVAAAAAAGPAWRAATVWRFVSEAVAPAPTGNPTGLAFDGSSLWISDWSGRLVSVDPADPRRVLLQAAPQPGGLIIRPRSPPAAARFGPSTRRRPACCATRRRRRTVFSPRARARGPRRPRWRSTERRSGPTTRRTARSPAMAATTRPCRPTRFPTRPSPTRWPGRTGACGCTTRRRGASWSTRRRTGSCRSRRSNRRRSRACSASPRRAVPTIAASTCSSARRARAPRPRSSATG
ncbi:MAG: hypothetical protein ACHQ2Z_09460 [Elusimicrobiota bacterium]